MFPIDISVVENQTAIKLRNGQMWELLIFSTVTPVKCLSSKRLGSQKEAKLLTWRDKERDSEHYNGFFFVLGAVIVEIFGCIGELWLTACRPKCQAGLGGTSASNRGPTTGVRLSCRATDPDVHLLEIHSYVPHPEPQMCCEFVMLIVSKHLPHALPCSPLHWQDQTTPPPGKSELPLT